MEVPFSPRVHRVLGAVAFAAFLGHRLGTRETYANDALFWLETAIPMAILAAYVTRPAPVRRARGWRAVALPLVTSVLPFGLILSPRTAFGLAHQDTLLALLCLPTALMVASYVALNRGFAIVAEARVLRVAGPYRWVRHPVYLAQLLAAGLVLIWRFSATGVVVAVAFTLCQITRIQEEEKALDEAFQDHAAYRARTWTLVPGLW